MPKTAFLKGFADGFFSPFTFFLPPVKKPRAPAPQAEAYKPCPLPDVSPAAAWAEVNARLAQAFQRVLRPYPQHLAHYQQEYADRLAYLDTAIEAMKAKEEAAKAKISALKAQMEGGHCTVKTAMNPIPQKK